MLVLTRDDTLRFVLWKAPGGLWTIRHMWHYSMETLSVYLSQTRGAPGQQVEPGPELGAPAPKPLNKPICSVSSEHTVVETLPDIPCAADTSSWRHSLREASVHHATSVHVSFHWITLLNAPAYVSNRWRRARRNATHREPCVSFDGGPPCSTGTLPDGRPRATLPLGSF